MMEILLSSSLLILILALLRRLLRGRKALREELTKGGECP